VLYPYLLVSFALFKFKAIHPRTYTSRCSKQGGECCENGVNANEIHQHNT